MLPLARRSRCRGHLGRRLRPGLGLIPRPGRRRSRLVSHFGDLESRMEIPFPAAVLRGLSELIHLPLRQLAAFRVSEEGDSLSFSHTCNAVQLAYKVHEY